MVPVSVITGACLTLAGRRPGQADADPNPECGGERLPACALAVLLAGSGR
ncbi:MAG: hypothetical protein HYR63_03285 [Proteobacteria bacterium]|nr:hypothetical protein [Pseudomonadota bacterium]MBI3495737.1 hypothetical protein [Pseudomonadota bacterium]